jgi:hypothetical protein
MATGYARDERDSEQGWKYTMTCFRCKKKKFTYIEEGILTVHMLTQKFIN